MPAPPAPARRRSAALLLCLTAALSLWAAGCRNLAEQRAVRRFGDALTAENLADLAEASTPQFAQTALDHEEALDDLRLLRLPKTDLKVISVAEVEESEWRTPDVPECLVITETPPPVRQSRFRLVRADAGRWLVDDVLLKQRKGNVKAVVSVTEQLELLAAVRGFTKVWAEGSAEARLAVVTPELRADLETLPAARFDELAGWVVDGDRVSKLRPDARMDKDQAAVQFSGRGYTLVLSLDKEDGAWLVSDAKAENRGGGPKIPSLKKSCVALGQVSKFLDAYAANDRAAVEETTASALYRGCLNVADFAAVPLPTADALGGESTFRVDGDTAEVVIPTEAGAVTVALTDPHRFDPDRRTGAFLVEEVTLRTADGDQKRLSTVFTARAAVGAFAEAAAAGDLDALKAASTRDFSDRVWKRIGPTDLAFLPLADAVAVGPVLTERHAGSQTEITLDTPAGPRTFVLRDESGASRVDDVLAPSLDLPESFRQTCELVLPARAFAGALASGDLGALRRNSSGAFDRLVWHQVRGVPTAAVAAAEPLSGRLAKATPLSKGEGARCELHYGTPSNGAVLNLVRERGRLVVDDVELIGGPHPDARVALKQAIRGQMADGSLRLAESFAPVPTPLGKPAPMRDAAFTPAAFTTEADPFPLESAADPAPASGPVRTAMFEAPAAPPAAVTKEVEPPPPFDSAYDISPFRAPTADPVRGEDRTASAPFAEPLPIGGE